MIDGNPTFERFADLHFGSGEAKTAWVRRNLKAASFPLHDVVVADDAFMSEAANALQIFRSGPPGFFDVAGRTSEAAVVVGQEAAQDLVGSVQIGGAG